MSAIQVAQCIHYLGREVRAWLAILGKLDLLHQGERHCTDGGGTSIPPLINLPRKGAKRPSREKGPEPVLSSMEMQRYQHGLCLKFTKVQKTQGTVSTQDHPHF